MKKLISGFLVLVFVLALCACGVQNDVGVEESDTGTDVSAQIDVNQSSASTQESVKEDRIAPVNYTADGRTVVRVAMQQDITNEGVWLANDGKGRKYIIYSVYENLAMLDGLGGELNGVMAKSWNRTDAYTYEIELYDYIYDTAGNHITASDVIFSFETALEPKVRNLKYVESLTASDDYHLTMVLNSTDVAVFDRIMFQTAIVSKKAYEDSGDEMKTQAVATGPYKITSWETGSKIVLEKNEDYWQTDTDARVNFQYNNVDVIEFYVIPEEAQQIIALETGKVDVVFGLTYEGAKSFMSGGTNEDGFVVFGNLDQNTRFLQFNCNEASQCSDINLRMAINYAIDASGLLAGVLDGQGEVTKGINSRLADYVESWADMEYYTYNLDTAKDYLKKSNYNGETLVLMVDLDEVDVNCALLIQNYLAELGIETELNSLDSTLVKTQKLDYTTWDLLVTYAGSSDYYTTQWRTTWDPGNTKDGLLEVGILDSKLDELLDTVRNVETFNDDSVTAFMTYLQLEKSYERTLVTPNIYTVSRDWMVACALNDGGWFMPGSCTYTWNQ